MVVPARAVGPRTETKCPLLWEKGMWNINYSLNYTVNRLDFILR